MLYNYPSHLSTEGIFVKRLTSFLQDREYMLALSSIAVPIIIQQFITSSLNLVDVLMIGQLGEVPVASVGLANQIGFLMSFVLFGIGSGAGVFTAQFWGNKDLRNIHKVLGIALTMSLLGCLPFVILAVAFPTLALGIYSQDAKVLSAGASFLQISGLSYILMAVSFSFSMVHRATGYVRLPTTVGAIIVIIKTFLTFCLVFGNFGFPQLGINGAAIATVIARVCEAVFLVTYTYAKKLPAAAQLSEMFSFNRVFLVAFLKIALPVTFNESLWSLGISVYNAVYARIGTESIAAYNIAATIEGMAFVIFIGVTDACAIMVGTRIGSGQNQKAYLYAKRSLLLNLLGGFLIGGCIILASFFVPSLYKISSEGQTYARNILIIMGCCLWIRVTNMILIVGVLRSGGDTRFGFLLDAGTLWVVGVPTALIAGFLLHLSIYWVYLLVMSEELIKMLIGIWRMRSRKWIHNLTQTAVEASTLA
jgi:putative MATE family efflux protein